MKTMLPILSLLLAACSAPPAVEADVNTARTTLAAIPSDALDRAIERVMPDVVKARRRIHENPELGERERETAAFIAAHLRELGLEVREEIGVTGVVGILRGEKPGGVVAYRADMDALPVTEQTGLPFASKKRDQWGGKEVGVMHACGHDMHVAIGLGVASALADPDVRKDLPGTVLFVFQPAEEGMPEPGLHGAARMLAEGVFDDPEPSAIFGLHVNPILPVGRVSVVSMGAMAAADRFRIRVTGQQTHGAYPQAGIDPIVVASHIVVALQTISSRTIDTRDTVVVSVGKFEAGNRFNIIPNSAELLGTIRTHDEKVQDATHAKMKELAEGIAASFGATAEVEIEKITPVTFNDPLLVGNMHATIEASVGEGNLVPEKAHMGAEDFAFFAREVPGLYYFLGVTDPSKGVPAFIHTPGFNPDERALPVGVRTSARLLLAYLAGEAR